MTHEEGIHHYRLRSPIGGTYSQTCRILFIPTQASTYIASYNLWPCKYDGAMVKVCAHNLSL